METWKGGAGSRFPADGQEVHVRETLHGLQETSVIAHRVQAGDVGDDRRLGRAKRARGGPTARSPGQAEPLGVDARIDDAGAAGAIAQGDVACEPGLRIADHDVRLRERAAHSGSPGAADADSGGCPCGSTGGSTRASCADGAGQDERQRGDQIAVVHPALDDVGPGPADEPCERRHGPGIGWPWSDRELGDRDPGVPEPARVCASGNQARDGVRDVGRGPRPSPGTRASAPLRPTPGK